MNTHFRGAALLLIAALAPLSVTAQDFFGINFSDITLRAFASVATQLEPIKTATDTHSAPRADPNDVGVLLRARGIPFPNLPNGVGSAFASSAGNNDGMFGVGVNGFFFTNSLPPDALLASVTFSQTITNNSANAVTLFAGITIPAPTLQLFGVGDSYPAGADPRRDVTASVNASFLTKITHPDGTVVNGQPLDYGLFLFRESNSGILFAIDADGAFLPRFFEPDGSFGFQLPTFHEENLALGEIASGDVMQLTLDYFASASTGFGETGIFAAIGDPFHLNAGGGGLDIHVGAAAAIPEPTTWTLLAAGLLAVGFAARARARR